MGLPGSDFKVQANGASGNWNEVIAKSASPEMSRTQEEIPEFGDDGQRRLQLLQDNTQELVVNTKVSPNQAIEDLEDSVIQGGSVKLQWSPDGHASGGPTRVYEAEFYVESDGMDAESGSSQERTFSLNNAKGTVSRVGSFSP